MIGSIVSLSTASPNLFALRGMSGRVAVPVNPVNSLYARFEHVRGVPAADGTVATSVLKLKILDDLLGRLGQLRSGGTGGSTNTVSPSSTQRVDATIGRALQHVSTIQAVPPAGSFLRIAA